MTGPTDKKMIGRYEIHAKLGEGGMAVVYKALDTRLKRFVALKLIRTEIFPPATLDQILARFEREATALAQMQHTNIVTIYDFGEHANTPYLVMEYLPGGTLRRRMGKPVPVAQAAATLHPVANAIAYAHSRGVAHRDVKPANILFSEAELPKLSDFGIVRMMDVEETTQLTATGMGIGTPAYMAPEQWYGQVSPAVDIYALGVVFYEMLTGRPPYEASTPAELLVKKVTQPLPDPRLMIPDLPDTVVTVLRRPLAQKPEDRFATMAEFVSVLGGLSSKDETAVEELLSDYGKTQVAPPIPVDDNATLYTGFVAPRATEREILASSGNLAKKRPGWFLPAVIFAGLGGLIILSLLCILSGTWLFSGAGPLAWVKTTPTRTLLPQTTVEDAKALLVSPPAAITPASTGTSLPTMTLTQQATKSSTTTVTLTFPPPTPTLPESPTSTPTSAIKSLSGDGLVRLTFDSKPYYMSAISPDQQRMVAFAKIGAHWQIVELDANGAGITRQITTADFDHWHPHFSQDGESILLASDRSGGFDIYLISFQTGEVVQQLTSGFGADMTPYWMPDYQSFVFMSNRDGDYEIYRGFLDGTDPIQLTHNDTYDGTCAVSPDGKQIVFYSNRSGNPDVHVMDVDTGDVKQLTFSANRDAEPAFSSDGEWIAFESDRNGNYDIWAIRPDGSGLYQVTSNGADEQVPVFSPDGHWLVYQSNQYGDYDLFRIPWP